ncbi:MAG: ABC-2 family transporter protein [Bacilli bacterium]|nr:ABC-2 family transporter protein [Bacilli bacterium]
MRRLRKYKPFVRASAIDMMAYRFNIITWAIVTVFEVACLIFLWLAVYQSSEGGIDSSINGFTYKEMIVYVVLTTIFGFITFNDDTLWFINRDIRQGTIGNFLIKPISYRGKFIASNIGAFLMMSIVFGIPLYAAGLGVLIGIGYLPVASVWDFIAHFALFLVASVLACLLNGVISYIFGILCFYTSAAWGLNALKTTVISFLSGTLLPIAFFPNVFREIVTYMPFAGMSQNPVLILMMKYDYLECCKVILISLAWLVLLELFAKLLFSRAIKVVTVQGG